MQLLDRIYLGNSVQTWLVAVGLGVIVLLGFRLLQRLVARRLGAVARRTQNDLDDLAHQLVQDTRFFLPLAIALYAGARPLQLAPAVDGFVRAVAVIALLVQAAIWGNAVIAFFINRYMERRMEEDAATATSVAALQFVGKLVLWSIVLLLALDNLGVDVTALVTGLGVGGIAVALALQNILGDLFASLSIVLDKPFVIGDFIIVGDMMGTVEHVGLKTTRVRSLSGEQLVFSNGDLLNSRIRNYKRMFERRVVFSIGVTYDTPADVLEQIGSWIREIIVAQADTRFDRAHFARYGDFALIYEVVYYVLKPDYNIYMDIQERINLEIYRKFESEGVEFAYPTQTLYLQKES